jgi:hypothetical protein
MGGRLAWSPGAWTMASAPVRRGTAVIICRKCQRHHPDSTKAATCPCGADLRRDGIALVSAFESPPPDAPLDELPPLDAETASPQSPETTAEPLQRTTPAGPSPQGGGPSDTGTEGVPDPAAALKGRRRRARPATPKRPTGETARDELNRPTADDDPAGPHQPRTNDPQRQPAEHAPETHEVGRRTADRDAGAHHGRATDERSHPTDDPGATGEQSHPTDDAGTTTTAGPGRGATTGGGRSESLRRARSVNPRDLVAAQDMNVPNVGSPPIHDAATSELADTLEADETETLPPPPGPGERACPACAEPNAESRRFCVACGARLPAIEPQSAADQPSGAPGNRRAPRSWRQRARAASEGPMRYSAGFTSQVKARVVLAVLAAIAVLVAVAGPARERVLSALGWGSSGLLPASAELVTSQGEPDEEVAGFGAANVHDDDRNTGVAIAWEPETGAEAEVEVSRLRLTFEEPTDVHEVRIAPGLADSAEDAPLVLKPSRIRLCADTGACQEVAVGSSGSLQTYGVGLGDDVRSIELTVLDVHETDFTTYPLAVISEVRIVS